MELFDSHAHFDIGKRQDKTEALLARARAAGVRYVTAVGCGRDPESMVAALALARREPEVFATAGIHPHDASLGQGALIDQLAEVAADPEVLAIGETGLDYHYDRSPRAQQREVFGVELEIARAQKKPVVLHIREAHTDALDILTKADVGQTGGIVHCFSSGPQEVEEYLALGLYISFSGIVTFPAARPVAEAAERVPADRLLIETDAPFLAPVPKRGKTNESAFVRHTAERLAELRGVPLEQLAAETTANAHRIFGTGIER